MTKSLLDVHVHLVALPENGNGCIFSNRMKNWPSTRIVSWLMKFPIDNPSEANRLYLERLIKDLRESQHVKQVVLLGMDGVYDDKGLLDHTNTHLLVSNDYVFSVVEQYPDLFKAGISINPQRRDAMEELERLASRGAALVKVLPNAQHFDLANPAYIPFYKKLAELKIPLLSHVGYEFALISHDQNGGDAKRLQVPLDCGVTVIAAHGMGSGQYIFQRNTALLSEFIRRYPNFYWDASALSLPGNVKMLLWISRHPEVHSRMLFGTDYPLPSLAYPALLSNHPKEYLELRRLRNPFDRHYRLLEILGLPVGRLQKEGVFI